MIKESPIDLLRDLVAFESVSKRSNEEIVSYLEKMLSALGFDTVRIESPDKPTRYNLLCKIGPDKEGGLMLSGHLDVVPTAFQNWQSDPFSLRKEDGRLFGRGTADMKGFIAACCSALHQVSLKNLKKPLTLLWTYDEEVGCVGSAHAGPLLKNYFKHLPKAALIGEPTDFSILRMHAGHATLKVSAKGKGAHSSDPDLGISAIKALNHSLNGLFDLEEELKREKSLEEFFKRPFVTMNIGEIHGGSAVNIVPDEAFAMVGFRPLPNTSVSSVVERITDAATKNQPDKRATITVSLEKVSPPMMTEKNCTLYDVLKPHAKETGICSAQYSTDGGNLNLAGIECLIFGPGTIDVAHQANEFLDEKDLFLAEEKIIAVLKTWFDA